MKKRVEKDLLGSVKLPSNVYYGVSTKRAKELQISGLKLQKRFLKSYTLLKKANAISNSKLGRIKSNLGNAIVKACNEIISDKFEEQFVIGAFQPGAGTAFHMNLNEVIANRANEILGKRKGSYKPIDPHNHVNLGQSTNDTFHSALRIAAVHAVVHDLLPALKNYEIVLSRKVREFNKILKTGRTHLRYAVPLSLGKEFSGFSIKEEIKLIKSASDSLKVLPLGGTAVGTGLTSLPKFGGMALKEINKDMKLGFRKADNMFAEMQNLSREVSLSGSLKVLAVKFIKVCNDLRFLYSDDVSEISLPAVMMGSSIMAGKVNPSVPEIFEMACIQIIGNDSAIAFASSQGNLEINVFMPIVAYDLLNSIELFTNGLRVFTERCLRGIKANQKSIQRHLEKNPAIATALISYIGYDAVAEVVKDSLKTGKGISQIVVEKKLMKKKDVETILKKSLR